MSPLSAVPIITLAGLGLYARGFPGVRIQNIIFLLFAQNDFKYGARSICQFFVLNSLLCCFVNFSCQCYHVPQMILLLH